MMPSDNKIDLEKPLLFFALFLGAFLRLIQLGRLPLGDHEAAMALNALDFSQGVFAPTVSATLYTNVTAGLFFLFAPSNFLARLVPAIAGILLVAAPLLFRDRLGKTLTVVLVMLFAVDPTLVAASRTVNLAILPIATFIWYFGALHKKSLAWMGVLLALFLLSGPQAWLGLAALSLTELILYLFRRQSQLWHAITTIDKGQWKAMASPFLFTYGLLGSFFLLNPTGLGSIVSSLQDVLDPSVLPTAGIPLLAMAFGFVLYELFGSFFALTGLKEFLGDFRAELTTFGSVSLVAAILAMINPARMPLDTAWLVPFILLLAAMFISSMVDDFGPVTREVVGLCVFTLILLVFIALNYFSLALVSAEDAVSQMRWTILIGSVTMLVISFVLVSYGWSFRVASRGIASGSLIFFALINLSQMMSAANLRATTGDELSVAYPRISTDTVLSRQLAEVSAWNGGSESLNQVTIASFDSPALTWQLRDRSPRFWSSLSDLEDPGLIVITPDGFGNPVLDENFRGQNIVWHIDIPFETLTPADWMKWSINHTFPRVEQKLILWIRADQFIDQQNKQ